MCWISDIENDLQIRNGVPGDVLLKWMCDECEEGLTNDAWISLNEKKNENASSTNFKFEIFNFILIRLQFCIKRLLQWLANCINQHRKTIHRYISFPKWKAAAPRPGRMRLLSAIHERREKKKNRKMTSSTFFMRKYNTVGAPHSTLNCIYITRRRARRTFIFTYIQYTNSNLCPRLNSIYFVSFLLYFCSVRFHGSRLLLLKRDHHHLISHQAGDGDTERNRGFDKKTV